MEWLILIMLIVVGFILLLLEFLVFPGVNVVGIIGFTCVGAAVYIAYSRLGATAGHLTLLAIAAGGFAATWYALRSKTWKRLQLDARIDSTVERVDALINEGDEGTCLGRLAPAGKIRVGKEIVEARSLGGYIDANSEVIVVKVFKNKVIVKLKTE
ncbi:MAG: NfeD family protein [Odoribacteraceae bacterium]|jgi:membrane-bound ClpP family serine protease|nr:NfeD family protein [Odoribacteraceae bacterium]